jgi:hypothetical protein
LAPAFQCTSSASSDCVEGASNAKRAILSPEHFFNGLPEVESGESAGGLAEFYSAESGALFDQKKMSRDEGRLAGA